jgi:hypothetical protein
MIDFSMPAGWKYEPHFEESYIRFMNTGKVPLIASPALRLYTQSPSQLPFFKLMEYSPYPTTNSAEVGIVTYFFHHSNQAFRYFLKLKPFFILISFSELLSVVSRASRELHCAAHRLCGHPHAPGLILVSLPMDCWHCIFG